MNKYLNDRCIVSDDGVFFYDSEDEIKLEDLERFIEWHSLTLVPKLNRYREYYKGHNLGLKQLPPKPNNKPDNRIYSPYAKKLVDTFTGFATGRPVKITLQEDVAEDSLSKWNKSRKMDSVVSTVWKESSIYGRAFFYVYDDQSEIHVIDSDPRETFIVYDNTVAHKPLYAVRYGSRYQGNGYKITLYSPDKQWNIDTSQANNMSSPVSNPFHFIPIVEVVENDERVGIIESVKSIIDALDKATSEKANDVDYFADAYLKVLGALLTEDELKNLRDNRVINLKSAVNDDEPVESLDVDFLSKPDADTTQENLINRLTDLLYQMSMVVNLNDKDFGNSTGVALEMKYKPMLNSATLKSRGFGESLKEMYQVVFASDQVQNISEDAWKDLDIVFQYDMPHDLKDEAETAQTLSTLISRDTWLKSLSIVNDVRQEEKNIDKEKQENVQNNLQLLRQNNEVTDGEANGNGQGREATDTVSAQSGSSDRLTGREDIQ